MCHLGDRSHGSIVRSFRGKGRSQYGTGTSRARYDHAPRVEGNTAIASVALDVEATAGEFKKTVMKWHKRNGRGANNLAKSHQIHDLHRGRRVHGNRVSPPHVAPAGLRPLRTAAVDPAPGSVSGALLLAVVRHLLPARHLRRQAQAQAIQGGRCSAGTFFMAA